MQPEFVITKFAEITGTRKKRTVTTPEPCNRACTTDGVVVPACDITQPEIGRLVGMVDYSAVSQVRKRQQEKMARDKQLKIKI